MIKRELNKIHELEELATSVNKTFSDIKVQGGKRKNIVEDTAIDVVTFTENLKKYVEEFRSVLTNVPKLIDTLENDLQKKILRMRYIHFMKWEDIESELHYAKRHIYR